MVRWAAFMLLCFCLLQLHTAVEADLLVDLMDGGVSKSATGSKEPEVCPNDRKPKPKQDSTTSGAGYSARDYTTPGSAARDATVHATSQTKRILLRFKLDADPVLKWVGQLSGAAAGKDNAYSGGGSGPQGMSMEDVAAFLATKVKNGWLDSETLSVILKDIPGLEQVTGMVKRFFYGARSRIVILDTKSSLVASSVKSIISKSDLVELVESDTTVSADTASTLARPLRHLAQAVANVRALSDDPMLSKQWGLSVIDLESAWKQTKGDKAIVVAVMDSGVDYKHPDLKDSMWVNEGEIAGNGIDDDGNGYVDDVYGYNFVSDDNDPMDDNGHGSHCAGIIAAQADNGVGIVGVAPGVSIMAVKILSDEGTGSGSDIVRGFEYAVGMRVNLLSASLGSYNSGSSYKAVLAAAAELGILVVASAGNDRNDNDKKPRMPGASTEDVVLAVASSMQEGCLSGFSNYGADTVDLVAPGSNILSTVPKFMDASGYAVMSGTSMATPCVAGAAALIMSYWKAIGQEYVGRGAEVRSLLLTTAKPDPRYTDFVSSGGSLDVGAAIEKAGEGTTDSARQLPQDSDAFGSSFTQASGGPTGQHPNYDPRRDAGMHFHIADRADAHAVSYTQQHDAGWSNIHSDWSNVHSDWSNTYGSSDGMPSQGRQYVREQYQDCGNNGMCCKQYNWNWEPLYCFYQNPYYSQCLTKDECKMREGGNGSFDCDPSHSPCWN